MKKLIVIFKRKFFNFTDNPRLLFIKLLTFTSPILSDRLYLKLLFPLKVGYKLNLNNPKTYNEKLQWLKLHDRNPYYTKLVDKYEVKKVVKEKIGEDYVITNYGVWDSFDEINFDELPNKFVLKTTHDSGGVVICSDKGNFNFKKAKNKIERSLKRKHYLLSREWPYKDVKPRIIAEEFLVDESNIELKDYKFFCFNGEPKSMFIATERNTGDVKFDFYDIEFNHLDIFQVHKQSGKIIEKPKNYELMIDVCRVLSENLTHVRIDLYNINGKILFGEYTFFHHGGLVPFHPQKWDDIFGKWITLPSIKR